MANRTKLELTWIGKDKRPRLEPRILVEEPELSHCAKYRVTDDDIFDNILIQGDNLLALKALEQDFTGKVKCIYIDPPYNTGAAFSHYDDGIEHSIWLGLMLERLQVLRRLLSDDGSIWISVDDNECHYLKVVLDEVFGRTCFVTSFIWRKVDSPNDNKVPIAPDHEYILCYTKTPNGCQFRAKDDASILGAYRRPDNESDRPYRDRLLKKNGKSSLRSDRPSMYFGIEAPDGTTVFPVHDDGRDARWAKGKTVVDKLIRDGELVWKKRENGWIPYTREFAPQSPTRPNPTIWLDLHTTRQAKAHQKSLLGSDDIFSTPKPEPLIKRIFDIATSRGDWILDSFLGSGTTAAVAHKMGLHWIGIELGSHAISHCIPRICHVINGTDQGGISEEAGWHGGGGFRFYRLAPSLLEEDRWGNWIINKAYNKEMLAEAMCKLEGFKYAPSDTLFWMHGQSTEQDYIYVTTQTLTHEQLQAISAEVGDDRTLLICCSAFRADVEQFPNLTVKKIPAAVLARCEWGKDDYSLNVQNVMGQEPESEPGPKGDVPGSDKPHRKGKTKNVQELPLFADVKQGGAE